MELTDYSSFTAYEREWEDSLDRIRKDVGDCSGIGYFIELARSYYKPELLKKRRAKVIMVDMSFPAEIVRALGEEPLFLPGGSFAASGWAENIVPRDTDAVIKAVLGMLINPELDLLRGSILLIPVNCDSMRKFSDLLKDYDCTIIPVEVPSSKTDPNLQERWKNEVRSVTAQLERKLHRLISQKKLARACAEADEVRSVFRSFYDVCEEKPGVISGSVRLFLANSWLWTTDRQDWMAHIRALTDEVRRKQGKPRMNPQILVIGSPIYFPNYKLPMLLESVKMDMAEAINPINYSLFGKPAPLNMQKKHFLDPAAEMCLAWDISPAFVSNDTLFECLKDIVTRKQINGVVLHILKGQIEYDFEMLKYEAYLEKMDIPIFRLETDYNYQDMEQLRIRLEAFSEMTTHKMRVQTGRGA